MKTLIMTMNSKYIHTSLALRLLYQATKDFFQINFKEYTIKDNIENIINDILEAKIDVVALSCYIWNIELHIELAKRLKEVKKDIFIIFGGPEVSYESEYFLKNSKADLIIQGEGEEVLPKLLKSLETNSSLSFPGISYKNKEQQVIINNTILQVDLKYVESLDSPYLLNRDLKDAKHRIIYIETSRGCPYQCSYCLSSIDKGLRFFSFEYLEKQLSKILKSEARIIKFLDRSFNVKKEHALRIFDYIIKHHKKNQKFQFEINADVLDQEIIDFIHEFAPKGLFRFEIGIQSTHNQTNKAICRRQNFNRLSQVINELIQKDKVTLHLDLIAGLPYESYNRFIDSFNQVFLFRAPELQLGFLKLLRGTKLREQAENYNYSFDQNPPYEIISNHCLNPKEIDKIHLVEDVLEKYWNSGRFKLTLNTAFDLGYTPYSFFYEMGIYFKEIGFELFSFQLYDLYLHFYEFTITKGINLLDQLKQDYLTHFKIKPKRWWNTISTKEKKVLIELISNNQDFMLKHSLTKDLLYHYSYIEILDNKDLLIIIYNGKQAKLYKYSYL